MGKEGHASTIHILCFLQHILCFLQQRGLAHTFHWSARRGVQRETRLRRVLAGPPSWRAACSTAQPLVPQFGRADSGVLFWQQQCTGSCCGTVSSRVCPETVL